MTAVCRDKGNPNVLTFTIDCNNHITALGSTPQSQVNREAARFGGAKDRGRLAKRWPGPRLVEIWNALPGQKPIKKFPNRKVAVSRIWAGASASRSQGRAQSLLQSDYHDHVEDALLVPTTEPSHAPATDSVSQLDWLAEA